MTFQIIQDVSFHECREMWTPLSVPCKFLALDFYSSNDNLQTFACSLSFDVVCGGTCNGMAFWFDLQLDEQTSLSSSPFKKEVSSDDASMPAQYVFGSGGVKKILIRGVTKI